jgi:hypothetical protein
MQQLQLVCQVHAGIYAPLVAGVQHCSHCDHMIVMDSTLYITAFIQYLYLHTCA